MKLNMMMIAGLYSQNRMRAAAQASEITADAAGCSNSTAACGPMPEKPNMISSMYFMEVNRENMARYNSKLHVYDACLDRVEADYQDCLNGDDDTADIINIIKTALLITGSICGVCCLLVCCVAVANQEPDGIDMDDIKAAQAGFYLAPRDYVKLVEEEKIRTPFMGQAIGWLFQEETVVETDAVLTQAEFTALVKANIIEKLGPNYYITPSKKPLAKRLRKYMAPDRADSVAQDLLARYKINYPAMFEAIRLRRPLGSEYDHLNHVDSSVFARIASVFQKNQNKLLAYHLGNQQPIDIRVTPAGYSTAAAPVLLNESPHAVIYGTLLADDDPILPDVHATVIYGD